MVAIKAVFCIMLIISIASTGLCGEWRERFDDPALKGWEIISKGEIRSWDVKWEVKDGRLYVSVTPPPPPPIGEGSFGDLLRWRGAKGRFSDLKIVVYGIRSLAGPLRISGAIGVFLGKEVPAPDYAEGYFVGGGVYKGRVDRKGRFREILHRAGGRERSLLMISFHNGRFRVTTRDEWGELVLTEFKDEDYVWVDVIGLMAFTRVGLRCEGSIEAISISGPGIPNYNADVKPEGKLTTLWGRVKSQMK